MKYKNTFKKILCVLMMTVMLSSAILPLAALRAGASSGGGSSQSKIIYGRKTLYHWKRVQKQADLAEFEGEYVRTMVMWGDGVNHAYYLHGTSTKGTDLIGNGYIDYLSDGFYTSDLLDSWQMWVYEWDYNKTGRHMWGVGFFCYDSNGNFRSLYEDHDNVVWKSDGSWKLFCVSTHCEPGDPDNVGYNAHTSKGNVMIMHERDGSDSEWEHNGDKLQFDDDGDWDYDQWVMYINDYTMSDYSISDYTVTSGSSLQIEGDIFLNDGCTLTVEPGATLSVKGNFINNGTILNYGTVIVYPDAQITFFDSSDKNGGTIVNYGSGYTVKKNGKSLPGEGNFIVMENGTVVQPGKIPATTSFQLKGNASAIIFGFMVIPHSFDMDRSHLRIEKSGRICSHIFFTKKLGSLSRLTYANMGTYGKSSNTSKNHFYGTESVIEFYGNWERFSDKENDDNVRVIKDYMAG